MNNNISKEKMDEFKKRLLKMKNENEVAIRSNEGSGPNDAAQELTDFANHPADMGTEQFEQEKDAGFNLMHKDNLQEINDALDRIANGTYGLSEKSGNPIPIERLDALPTARNLVGEEESN